MKFSLKPTYSDLLNRVKSELVLNHQDLLEAKLEREYWISRVDMLEGRVLRLKSELVSFDPFEKET